MSIPKVGDFMHRGMPTIRPDLDIYQAIDFLVRHRLSGVFVVNAKNQVLGILSEKDCLKVLAKGAIHGPAKGPVANFMTTQVVSIPRNMDIYFAAGKFLGTPFRLFPVIEKDCLVGQITRRDILRGIQSIHRRGKNSSREEEQLSLAK